MYPLHTSPLPFYFSLSLIFHSFCVFAGLGIFMSLLIDPVPLFFFFFLRLFYVCILNCNVQRKYIFVTGNPQRGSSGNGCAA
jgi:hypothetical protein